MSSKILSSRTERLAILAVVVLGIATIVHRQALNEQTELLARAMPILRQVEIRDRIMGTRLPDLELVGMAGTSADLREQARNAVVWLVTPEDCPGCLQNLGEWNVAAITLDVTTLVILAGVSPAEGIDIVNRAGIEGPVLIDPAERVSSALGGVLPSTHLLVDAEGIVRMADTRPHITSCNWSFIAQVAALQGDESRSSLRT